MFSFGDLNFVASQDELSSFDRGEPKGTDHRLYQLDSSLEEGLLVVSSHQQQEQQLQLYLNSEVFDDQRFDIFSPTFQTCLEEIAKHDYQIPSEVQHVSEFKTKNQNQNQNQTQNSSSFASLELLKKYDKGRINFGRLVEPSSDPQCVELAGGRRLSTEEIVRVAGARFIQSSCQEADIVSMLQNPFSLSFSDLSDEESKNVQLVELLLASAEKVGYQQYERASRLLNYCDFLSSDTGDPVQRIVYYFSAALQERIDRATQRFSSKDYLRKIQSTDLSQDLMTLNQVCLAYQQKIPFVQIARFTAVQAIVENLAGAKKIHIIDLEIRNGTQWPILMQALMSRHDCPLELLKISAAGTTSEQLIEHTGKRLSSFAESMNVPLSFKAIKVSDMLDLKKELFDLDSEETVVIYCECLLMKLIALPDRLEYLMRILREINPNAMVIIEIEANNNSPSFVNRFTEALFFFSAYFDSFDVCMERQNPSRMRLESMFFNHGIRDIVAREGEERRIRHVKIDVWRSFLARFKMTETELSSRSLYQASLVQKSFVSGSYCTVEMNEKSLIIGWKGTPINSLSIWKFI